MPVIRLVTRVTAPAARCFDLARSVEVHLESLRDTGETVVDGVRAGLLGPGDAVTGAVVTSEWSGGSARASPSSTDRVTFATRWCGARWPGSITTTTFRPAAGGGTEMEDVFDYDAPLGLLGDLAGRLFLTRHLTRLLEARAEAIKAIAESERWRAYTEA